MALDDDRLVYSDLPKLIISSDRSIRFCGIVDKLGHLVHYRYREGAKPMLSEQENKRYALLTTIRRRPTLPWQDKLGKTQYFVMRNEKLIRATLPLSSNHLLLVYFDVKDNNNFDRVIMNKVYPIMTRYGK